MYLKVNRFSKLNIKEQKDGKKIQKQDLRSLNNLFYDDSGKQPLEIARGSFNMPKSARKFVYIF